MDFLGPLISRGRMNVSSSMRFNGADVKHEIGGGMIMDEFAELVLERGEMDFLGPLISRGRMNVSSSVRFNGADVSTRLEAV